MKTYRSLPNTSDGIFPVSFSVRSPFELRSSSVDPPFNLRSFSVRQSKIDQRMIEEISEIHRRQDGDVSKL